MSRENKALARQNQQVAIGELRLPQEKRDLISNVHAALSGAIVAHHFFQRETTAMQTGYKPDNTAVTRADVLSEHAMLDVLRRDNPNIGQIAEETGDIVGEKLIALVDGIDGTFPFTNGEKTYVVMCGLMNKPEEGQKVNVDLMKTAAIAIPEEHKLVYGDKDGVYEVDLNDEMLPIGEARLLQVYNPEANKAGIIPGLTVVLDANNTPLSRPKTLALEDRLGDIFTTFSSRKDGSNGYDQCRAVRKSRKGERNIADLYVGVCKSGIWDYFIGGAMIKWAGGKVVDYEGNNLHAGSHAYIGGSQMIVDTVEPTFQQVFEGYKGFK